MGGHDGVRPVTAVERYDPNADAWSAGPHLQEARFGAAAAVIDGFIYVAGGHDGRHAISSVERLPLVSGIDDVKWMTAPGLSVARLLAAAQVLDRTLFVIGGTDTGNHSHCTAEWLDLGDWRWKIDNIPPQLTQRLGASVASCAGSGVLLLAGGYADGDTELRALASAECFNAVGRAWSHLPPMGTARIAAAATAAEGDIYILGGRRDNSGTALASVERWSAQKACWEALAPMGTPRDAVAATVSRF